MWLPSSVNRYRVTVVPVRCHSGWCDAGDRLGRTEGCSGSRHVASLAQPYVHQRPRCVDGSIEIAPAASDLHVVFVYVPASSDLTAATPAPQALGQGRCELGLPVAHRLVA